MLNQGVYILSLDGRYILNAMESENHQYSTENRDIKKLFDCSLPYSLDLIQLNKLAPESITLTNTISNGKMIAKQYTNAIVNVTFNKAIYEYKDVKINKINKKTGKIKSVQKKGKVIYTTKDIRKKLYTDGFIVDGIKYVLFKRSSSKARLGSSLFIKEDLYERMINWSRIGIEFDKNIATIEDDIAYYGEKVDLAGIRAYESLTLSSIEDIVTINADEILLIDDVDGKFMSKASVTTLLEDGSLETITKEIEINNSIFDGQSLADSSLFKNDKGMELLRNRLFKSCAFNTNIQGYFKDNSITQVTDMFGKKMDAIKIKLITTPNSLKIFKFAYKIGDGSNKSAYQYWLDNLDSNFGICKYEKPSKFNGYNKLSYQMINSMPFDEQDMRDLVFEELRYIELLKNDLNVFRHHISNYDLSSSREFIYNILSVNSKVKETKLFKDFRRNTIDTYVLDLRKGKIKIPQTDYAILFGNPYEMLYIAGHNKKFTDTLHKGKEIWCPFYKHGEQLVGFRNPHICTGNVLVAKNVYHKEFEYFNLTDNIVIINSYDNDIYDRLQGCDLDSDSCLLSNNKTVLKRALECINYPTPVSKIKPTKVKNRYYNPEDMADIDYTISQNKIGEIVNWSQIFNSYYWDIYNKGDYDQDLLDAIYNVISMLSSLSQVEIDKAKKFFNIDMDKILDGLKNMKFNGINIVKKDYTDVYKSKITTEQTKKVEKWNKKIKSLDSYSDKDEISTIRASIKDVKKINKEKMVRPNFFK